MVSIDFMDFVNNHGDLIRNHVRSSRMDGYMWDNLGGTCLFTNDLFVQKWAQWICWTSQVRTVPNDGVRRGFPLHPNNSVDLRGGCWVQFFFPLHFPNGKSTITGESSDYLTWPWTNLAVNHQFWDPHVSFVGHNCFCLNKPFHMY